MRRRSSTFDACQLEKLAVCIATRLAGWDTPSIRWFVGLMGLRNHSGEILFRNLPTVSTVSTVTWSTRLFPACFRGIRTIIPIQGCGNYSLAYRRLSFRKGPCDMCPNMPRRFVLPFNSATWFTKMSRMLCILMVHSKLWACHLSLQLFRAHRWCDLAIDLVAPRWDAKWGLGGQVATSSGRCFQFGCATWILNQRVMLSA